MSFILFTCPCKVIIKNINSCFMTLGISRLLNLCNSLTASARHVEFFWLHIPNVSISSRDCQCLLLSSLLNPKWLSTWVMNGIPLSGAGNERRGRTHLDVPVWALTPSTSRHISAHTCCLWSPPSFLLTSHNTLELFQLPRDPPSSVFIGTTLPPHPSSVPAFVSGRRLQSAR